MEEKLQCHFCSEEGNEGIIILNKYICRKCELEISSLSSGELKYEGIKRNIKDIWKGVLLNINQDSINLEF